MQKDAAVEVEMLRRKEEADRMERENQIRK